MKGRRFDPGSGHGETRRVEWIPAVGFSFASLGERREVVQGSNLLLLLAGWGLAARQCGCVRIPDRLGLVWFGFEVGWRSVLGCWVSAVGHDARSLWRRGGCGGSNSAWTSVLPQAWSGTLAPGAWLAVVDVFTTTVSLNRGCGRGRAPEPPRDGCS